MTWSKDELRRIAEADDLHISPFREDGKTYGTPTWIWSVAVDGDLYVRAYNGQDSRWYQAAVLVYCGEESGKGVAAGLIRDVGFDPVDAGPLRIARYTEPFALLVAQLAYEGTGGPELAYRFERFGEQA